LLEEHLSRAKEEREKSAKPLAKLVKKLHGES
jgi:hypothetical protein